MSSPAATPIDYIVTDAPTRAAINRANAEHSTGPRSTAGKQRSSLNALRHGLTAHTAVLPSEDPAAYATHCRQFMEEHQPANATENHLVQELAEISWRLRRIPLLEADLLARAANPPNEEAAIAFDIVDAHRLLASLGLHNVRLSRQFQKTLDQLRAIQLDRQERHCRNLMDAAILREHHKQQGTPWEPSDYGFVLSKDQVDRAAARMRGLHDAREVEYLRFGSFSNPVNRTFPNPARKNL